VKSWGINCRAPKGVFAYKKPKDNPKTDFSLRGGGKKRAEGERERTKRTNLRRKRHMITRPGSGDSNDRLGTTKGLSGE